MDKETPLGPVFLEFVQLAEAAPFLTVPPHPHPPSYQFLPALVSASLDWVVSVHGGSKGQRECSGQRLGMGVWWEHYIFLGCRELALCQHPTEASWAQGPVRGTVWLQGALVTQAHSLEQVRRSGLCGSLQLHTPSPGELSGLQPAVLSRGGWAYWLSSPQVP